MEKKWTEAQIKAIESKGSVLVSASAGTGKTAVLTEKVSNCIAKENIDIKDILVMTFSSAAADEMKERIIKKLRELSKDSSITRTQQNRIFEEIKDFYASNIQTIHSFCNEVVKTYFYKVDLDPNMKIADNFDVNIFKLEAARIVLDREYFLMDPDFVTLEEYIDGTDSIENVIIKTYDKMMSFINPMEWIKEAVEAYNVKADKIPVHLANMVANDFRNAIDNYNVAIMELEAINDSKMAKNLGIMRADVSILERIVEDIEKLDINAITEKTLNDFAPVIRFSAKDDTFDLVKEKRNEAKDSIVKKYKNTGFNFKDQINRIRNMYPMALKFMELIEEYGKVYAQKKQENNVIDFNDMERYAYKILQDDIIADEYKAKFKKVFVDEYQDTSPVQEAIISRVSKDNNLFCVGDVKQSIYGFRASDPTLFTARSDKYKSKTAMGNVISLNNNFRSSQNVLDCANDVFKHITKASKELTYSDSDELIHGRLDDSANNPVVVSLINDDMKDNFPGLTNEEIEIYNIVNIIKNNVGQPIYDPNINDYRPADYKDIVVSCRKLTGLSDYIAQIFSANNIPFYIERSGNLLDTIEIQILMNLIDLANNSQDDLKIISVVHEGLFGFTDEDLLTLRAKSMEDSYYKIILKTKDEQNELGYKCQRLLNYLADVKAKESKMKLTEVLDYMISSIHFNDIFAVMSNGKQRVANIKLFQKHAFDFEEKSNEKLVGFMKYIRKIQETEEQVDEAKINYTENCVRVTTIHKSKGLEYPIEILGFMGKAFSTIDKRSNIVIDRDAGIGFRYFDDNERVKGKCLQRTYVENILTSKLIEEEMRLLYVAMTRAQEKLYIQAMVPAMPSFNNLVEPNSMIDWILSTLSTSGKSHDMFVSAEEEFDIKLVGTWKVKFTQQEELEEYVNTTANSLSDEDFSREYSAPYIPYEQEIVEVEDIIPVAIPSSKIKAFTNITDDPFVGDFETPGFMASSSLDTAQIGTATHDFMKNLDLKQSLDYENIIAQRNLMLENNIMLKEDLDIINYKKIAKFFTSKVGQMVKSADKTYKEKSMNILKSAMDIGLTDDNREILIRCIADLIFELNGEYYLLDYKTDRIKNPDDNDEIAQRVQSHQEQISIYIEAFEKIYKKKISKAYLAFLDISDAVEVIL